LAQVGRQQQAPWFAHTHRPWGSAAYGGFSCTIQDMLLSGLFQAGDPHARPLDAASFRAPWKQIDLETAAQH